MKGSKAKEYKSGIAPSPDNGYYGKTSNGSGAKANKPGKKGNGIEGKKV